MLPCHCLDTTFARVMTQLGNKLSVCRAPNVTGNSQPCWPGSAKTTSMIPARCTLVNRCSRPLLIGSWQHRLRRSHNVTWSHITGSAVLTEFSKSQDCRNCSTQRHSEYFDRAPHRENYRRSGIGGPAPAANSSWNRSSKPWRYSSAVMSPDQTLSISS